MPQISMTQRDFIEVFGVLEFLVISLDRIGSLAMSRRESSEVVNRFIDEADVFRRLSFARRLLSVALDDAATPAEIETIEKALQSVQPWDHRTLARDAKVASTRTGDDAIALMKAFVLRSIDVHHFAQEYHDLWCELRDSGRITFENNYVQRALNVVFTAIDDAENPLKGKTLENQADVLWLEVRAVFSVCHGI